MDMAPNCTGREVDLKGIEDIFRNHSRNNDHVTLDHWVSYSTLCRYRDWTPRPERGQLRLMDVGCYQPSIGYYFELGWREVVGIAKEEGEMVSSSCLTYNTSDDKKADIVIMDIEKQEIPLDDESIDSALMMEVIEHFGLDPMHALMEVNRVLKANGRLVLSTPNAAHWKNVYRILRGQCPFSGLEFSGFSTNRHNRLYDSFELSEMISAAGFEVEVVASRGYARSIGSFWERVVRRVVKMSDRIQRIASFDKRDRERQEYLFVVAKKAGTVRNRYPKSFYFDPDVWGAWYRTIKGNRRGAGDSVAKAYRAPRKNVEVDEA